MFKFPWAPAAIEAGAGVASGLLLSYQIDSWAASPKNTAKTIVPPIHDFGAQPPLWLGLGLLIAGVVGEVAEWPHPDVTEPALGAGALLVGQQVSLGIAQRNAAAAATAVTTTTSGTGRIASPAARRVQEAGPRRANAAFLEMSAPGVL